ncbi:MULTISPECIES: DUF6850 family outer membrane beta-barrel protein [Myroides]|uniref:DUF6850 domain-containing protein n=1 Tax=Myroides albus TaxID=2562892 RepID=A0A6I3LM00_9FLAO|nr:MULTISPECIES: DUF6850 family outer membrane beta-barrel protein [Myroides]MTG97015.1 hypothetical protein [Myroides albus]MVX35813.1 hypothetical protein [Myroides sp. LoEW2-1]UVD78560.1 hypothetical protein NWE55_10500 [Myroides albus]
MKKIVVNSISGLFVFILSLQTYAQHVVADSLYINRELQTNVYTEFGKEFFANRSYMYSAIPLSYSELNMNYQSDRKDAYLVQDGDGLDAFSVNTFSYQRLKGNKVIWGGASYKNQKQKNMMWNENMDRHILGPYVVGDSIGGTMKQDIYHFSGGIAKEWRKFTLGAEVTYTAKSGYREVDPRPKNTVSDLKVHLGITYNVFKDYEIGVYTHLNKYSQNSSLKFVNLLGKPIAYHLTGLGSYNYYFSSAVDMTNLYEGFGYDVGGTIAKNKGKDFVIQGAFGKFQVDKGIGSSPAKDMSKLETKKYTVSAVKYIDFEQHRLGAKVSYLLSESRGTEYFYSKVEKLETKIAEKELYKFVRSDIYTSIFYQYSTALSRFTVTPLFGVEQTDEKRRDTQVKQRFTYIHLGIEVDYLRSINTSSTISLKPYFKVRNLKETTERLKEFHYSPAMNQWVKQDYMINSANYFNCGLVVRYDFKVQNLPNIFVQTQFEQVKYNVNETNNFVSATLGVTF